MFERFALAAVLVAAGIIWKIVRPAAADMPNEDTSSTDPTLDSLKALNEGAFRRWEKRREYEWKLSFSLWTAIAAFIGVVIGKDSGIDERVAPATLVAGALITIVHGIYLYGVIHNTLKDLDKQVWTEEAIHHTLSDDPKGLRGDWEKDAQWPSPKQGWLAKYHGFLQVAITLVLCACAFLAVKAPKSSAQAASASSIPVQTSPMVAK